MSVTLSFIPVIVPAKVLQEIRSRDTISKPQRPFQPIQVLVAKRYKPLYRLIKVYEWQLN